MPDGASITAKPSDLTKTTEEQDSWSKVATDRKLGGYQWLRLIKLMVYAGTSGGKGDGIDVSQMRIDFRLTKMINPSPNLLDAKVYNLAPKTIEKIKQYHRVQLSAGHKTGNYGMIFDGTVVLYVVSKENPVDSFVQIIAGDGDVDLNSSIANLSFPPGTFPKQKVEAVLKQNNIPLGAPVDMGKGQQKTLRYSHFLGSMNRLIRQETNATASDFFIDDGKAFVIPTVGYRKGEIVDLSPTTGLVGIPKVTPNGIEAICLLNAKLRLGGLFHIDSKLLSDVPWVPGGQPMASVGPSAPGGSRYESMGMGWQATGVVYSKAAASLSPTGIYKILVLNHYGDTRGNPWYSELIGAAAGTDGELLKTGYSGSALDRSVFKPGGAANPAPPKDEDFGGGGDPTGR
jgi:hypothetical protein